MHITTLKLAVRDELLKALYHPEEKKFVIATRSGLDIFVEENMKIRRIDLKSDRPTTVVTHDAIFVRRQMLKRNNAVYYIQEVTADSDGSIRGYSCANGKLEWAIAPGSSFGEVQGHCDSVVQIVKGPIPAPGASPILVSCGIDGLAFSWNIDVRNKINVFDRFPGNPKARIPATAVSYLDNLNVAGVGMTKGVAVGYADGVICLYDFNNGKLLMTLNENFSKDFKINEVIMDPTKLKSVPRWKNSVRGLFWSSIYQSIFASIGDEGVYGYDPACSTPTDPIAHNKMNCAYLRPLGPIPELGVGEEGVGAFVATDGRVMLMRPTYSAARGEGHFIPICTAFSIYEYPPTSTFIMDMGKPTGRCLVMGYQKTIQIIAFAHMPNVLIHGNSEMVKESVGANTHKINFDVETELTDKNRYLSLIPEPLPNEIRYKLAEKEREIGIKTEGSNEQLERILEQFKDIKTGKVKKVKMTRKVEVPLTDEREGEEIVNQYGQKIKLVDEEYEAIVEEEVEEIKDDENEEDDLLNDILDIKYFKRLLRKVTPEGVCPRDVINTSLAQIEDSLELLKQVSLLFKVKVPKIDVEGMASLSEEQINALDVASTVMNTAYPTVGIETDTGVSTAESKQQMKIQHLSKQDIHPEQAPSGGMAVVAPESQFSNMPGMGMEPQQQQQQQQQTPGMPGGMFGNDTNLPPYMRAQKVNPYANAYGNNAQNQAAVTVTGGAPMQNNFANMYGMQPMQTMQSMPGMSGMQPQQPGMQPNQQSVYNMLTQNNQARKNVYGADAYASIAYERPTPAQPAQPQIQTMIPQLQPEPKVVENYSPALLSSFDAFDILSRIVARSIAQFIKRAAIVDTRLLVTFGGREAKDLAVSLGSADEDVSIVKAKFDRQRKIIEARQEDEIKSIKDMFAMFKKNFAVNLPREKKTIAARFEILRRAYNDIRCRVAKKSADRLLKNMLSFFPRFTVIGTRWVIIPSPPKSYPAFNAYDMLRDKLCSVHPVTVSNQDEELLFGIANVDGVIRPSGMARSEDAFKKLYIVAPLPPKYTLRDLLDKMQRALHPREVAHLIFPLVCTLARLQVLPKDGKVVIHRDIRPSTIFLTPNPGMSIEDFMASPYPQYDPNAPVYDNGNVMARRWPIPPVPTPSIFHMGVVRNCVMDEPIELNTMYCAPEVILGGMCECTDTWSIGLLCIKLLLPQLGGMGVTRMTRVAMPTGPLEPVRGNTCTCSTSVAGYLNDVARLSGVFDRINMPLIDDFSRVCSLPLYGVNLLKTSLPIQQSSVNVNVQAQTNPTYNMNTYGGINAFVQQNAQPVFMADALETLLPNIDPGTVQFVKDCLAFNPRERPSPVKLAFHPWFREHGLRVF